MLSRMFLRYICKQYKIHWHFNKILRYCKILGGICIFLRTLLTEKQRKKKLTRRFCTKQNQKLFLVDYMKI